MLSLCPFDISVGVGAFLIGLGQISSFLSLHMEETFQRYVLIEHSSYVVYVGFVSILCRLLTLLVKFFQSSCLDKIEGWFKDNLAVWASLLAFIAIVQVNFTSL